MLCEVATSEWRYSRTCCCCCDGGVSDAMVQRYILRVSEREMV